MIHASARMPPPHLTPHPPHRHTPGSHNMHRVQSLPNLARHVVAPHRLHTSVLPPITETVPLTGRQACPHPTRALLKNTALPFPCLHTATCRSILTCLPSCHLPLSRPTASTHPHSPFTRPLRHTTCKGHPSLPAPHPATHVTTIPRPSLRRNVARGCTRQGIANRPAQRKPCSRHHPCRSVREIPSLSPTRRANTCPTHTRLVL